MGVVYDEVWARRRVGELSWYYERAEKARQAGDVGQMLYELRQLAAVTRALLRAAEKGELHV